MSSLPGLEFPSESSVSNTSGLYEYSSLVGNLLGCGLVNCGS